VAGCLRCKGLDDYEESVNVSLNGVNSREQIVVKWLVVSTLNLNSAATEQFGLRDKAADLFLFGLRFESRLEFWLYELRSVAVFLSPFKVSAFIRP
jgi:hypothetical protein